MIWKCGTEATGYINVISQRKVKIHNSSIKMKNYEIKREQFQQKRMFRTNAFQLYKELNGTGKEEYISPDPDKATKLWNDIWSVSPAHNQDIRWL